MNEKGKPMKTGRTERLPKWTENRAEKVYWLWAEGTTFFKFGFTQQSVRKRISNMQVSCPHAIRFIAAAYGSREDEQKLHRLLSRFRRVGEWFNLAGQERIMREIADAFGCIRV